MWIQIIEKDFLSILLFSQPIISLWFISGIVILYDNILLFSLSWDFKRNPIDERSSSVTIIGIVLWIFFAKAYTSDFLVDDSSANDSRHSKSILETPSLSKRDIRNVNANPKADLGGYPSGNKWNLILSDLAFLSNSPPVVTTSAWSVNLTA